MGAARGTRLFKLENREKTCAFQRRVNGGGATEMFKTDEAGEAFAESLAGDVKELGTAAFRLDESKARGWRLSRFRWGRSRWTRWCGTGSKPVQNGDAENQSYGGACDNGLA